MLRRLLTPRWLAGLLLSLVAAAVMVRLGAWQLGRGEARHSLQNYSYAVEWVLFAAFTVFCYAKLLRDEDRDDGRDVSSGAAAHGSTDRDGAATVIVPPARAASAGEPEDPELAAYNAYLARLNTGS